MRFLSVIGIIIIMLVMISLTSAQGPPGGDERLRVEVTLPTTVLLVDQSFEVHIWVIGRLGLPQFYLTMRTSDGEEQDLENPVIKPARPEPIVTNGDGASFTLRAVRPGRVVFRGRANGEIWDPDCGGTGGCFRQVWTLPGESPLVSVFDADTVRQVYLPLFGLPSLRELDGFVASPMNGR